MYAYVTPIYVSIYAYASPIHVSSRTLDAGGDEGLLGHHDAGDEEDDLFGHVSYVVVCAKGVNICIHTCICKYKYIHIYTPLIYTYIYFPHRVGDVVGHGPKRRQGGGDAGADAAQPVEAEVEAGGDLFR